MTCTYSFSLTIQSEKFDRHEKVRIRAYIVALFGRFFVQLFEPLGVCTNT